MSVTLDTIYLKNPNKLPGEDDFVPAKDWEVSDEWCFTVSKWAHTYEDKLTFLDNNDFLTAILE